MYRFSCRSLAVPLGASAHAPRTSYFSVRGSHQTIWGPPLPNVTRHSGWWPHTVTRSIDRTLHQFLTFYLIVQGFHRTYATGAACQQRTLTPPDTWSCPTLGLACETNLSWTCLVSGPLNFEHPSVLLFCFVRTYSLFIWKRAHSLLQLPSPAYGVHFSQLVRYTMTCSKNDGYSQAIGY